MGMPVRLRYAYSRMEKLAYARGWLSARRLTLPDFLGIGAQKAGTTWLYRNLRKHPDLYLPEQKELHYFDWHFHQPLRSYARHFQAAGDRRKGELTPGYGILPPERVAFVRRLLPDLRLLLLLRNPIERAWSQALMNLVTGPGRPFDDVPLQAFVDHFRSERSVARGDYLLTVDTWLRYFPEDRLFIGFFDDITTRPRELLTDVFRHLSVSTDVDWQSFPVDDVVFRGPGVPLSGPLADVLHEMYARDIERLAGRFGGPAAQWAGSGR